MPPYSPECKPAKVPRCRIPGHRKHQAGCSTCKAWSNYYRLLLRWEHSVGINRGPVPAAPVRQHLLSLIETGNRRQWDIAEESGYDRDIINQIIQGHRDTVMAVTAEALLALKPVAAPVPPKGRWVPAFEGRRTLRGLAAQGWAASTIGDLMGGTTAGAAQKMMTDSSPWMLSASLDRIRAVARVLGGKDIRVRKLPGMDVRAKNNATKRGWPPLWAWQGRDIADPDAEPRPFTGLHLVEDQPDTDDAGADLEPYVDPVLLSLVRRNAERLEPIRSNGGRPDDEITVGWVDPITVMTRLERYVVVAYGTDLGMSLAELAALLGYPRATKQETENGKRAVSRVRTATATARAWLDSDPAGETPTWWQAATASADFDLRIPALLAVQPAPIGPGWDLAELAKRCGVAEDEMCQFVADATRRGDRPWWAGTSAGPDISHAA